MKMEVSERILELQFFDYVGVPSHQRGWIMVNLTEGNLRIVKSLRDFYKI
jgi:hypothetical protein